MKFPAVFFRGGIGPVDPSADIGTEFDLVSPGVITSGSCWDLSKIRGGLIQTSEGEAGRRQGVRKGCHPPREWITGVGQIPIRQPRVHDRLTAKRLPLPFCPNICVRHPPSMPWFLPCVSRK